MNTNKNTSLAAKRSLLKDQKGLSTVEYIIILVLIAVTGIIGWQNFGKTVKGKIEGANQTFQDDVVSGSDNGSPESN
ncbi:MAG: hypothetical protein IPJ88_04375 [Myxococcales bacterium]|nr:MAG: hypothetical protein IPJ88_04375 [Myxococcales bacterium]